MEGLEGGEGQEEGHSKRSGTAILTEPDALLPEEEGEELGGQGLQTLPILKPLINSEMLMMQFQSSPPWTQAGKMMTGRSCSRTESGTSLSIVRLSIERQDVVSGKW